MSEPPLFEPRRFHEAAVYYRGGRAPYPPRLIRCVAEIVGLRDDHRVLDLGCGPGQLAIGFAYFAGEVIGLDPEPQMLTVATNAALGLTPNVSFRLGSSFDLDPTLGQFRLVTMGRSFHWMDRQDTLQKLDSMIENRGAVALFGNHHPDAPENEWHAEWRAIIERYAHNDAAHERRRSASWMAHESLLLASPFCRLERVSLIARQVSTADSLIERARSMSSLSSEQLGQSAEQLVQDLRTLLLRVAPGGALTEVLEWSAVVARRA